MPYRNEHTDLRDYRRSVSHYELPPWRRWIWIVVFAFVCGWLAGCAPRPPVVVVVVPVVPITHHIGGWADADTVCVAIAPAQAVYVKRRCVSMATIRALILTARSADDDEASR